MNTNEHAYQERYWNELTELRISVYYLEMLESRLRKKDFFFRAFLLVASAGSVAGWVIWEAYPGLWAGIIGLAQLLTVLEPIMPFRRLLKGVSALSPTRENHAIDVEEQWLDVAEGNLTNTKINALCAEIQRRRLRDATSHLKEIVIPDNRRIMEAAIDKTDRHFKSRYGDSQ